MMPPTSCPPAWATAVAAPEGNVASWRNAAPASGPTRAQADASTPHRPPAHRSRPNSARSAVRSVLQSWSDRLLPLISWEETEDHNVRVTSGTADYYRFLDLTPHAEFVASCIVETIDEILPGKRRICRPTIHFAAESSGSWICPTAPSTACFDSWNPMVEPCRSDGVDGSLTLWRRTQCARRQPYSTCSRARAISSILATNSVWAFAKALVAGPTFA